MTNEKYPLNLCREFINVDRMSNSRLLPPMNALRGFEAAARRSSFTDAALELGLTPGAVSRQIRELEAHLGFALFVRTTRSVELTRAGAEYCASIRKVFDELELAQRAGRSVVGRTRIRLSALPTINALWLMPRLHEWSRLHQDVGMEVHASTEPITGGEAIDLAIRVGKMPGRTYAAGQPRIDKKMVASWEGIEFDELFEDVLLPVCSAELIGNHLAAAELLSHPLIHTTTRGLAWPDWFRTQGVHWIGRRRTDLTFGHFFMGLDAARMGRGVALIPSVFLSDPAIMKGLAIPCHSSTPSAGSYCLLIAAGKRHDPVVIDIRDWLLAQARETIAQVRRTFGEYANETLMICDR